MPAGEGSAAGQVAARVEMVEMVEMVMAVEMKVAPRLLWRRTFLVDSVLLVELDLY